MQQNYFKTLSEVDVSDHIELKGQFSYLSWPFAVSQLRLADPTATWEVKRFNGLPYMAAETGYFVEVAVTVQGITLSQIHPVLDADNIPIAMPTSFDINTSIQRCLVKAIALHGIGLGLYTGEDLPKGASAPPKLTEVQQGKAKVPPKLSEEQQAKVRTLIKDVAGDEQKLLIYFKVKSLGEIPASEYERVMKSLIRSKKAA